MEHLQCSTSERSEAIKEFGAKGSDQERERERVERERERESESARERERERESDRPSRNLAVKSERVSNVERERERERGGRKRLSTNSAPTRPSNSSTHVKFAKNKSTFQRKRRQKRTSVCHHTTTCHHTTLCPHTTHITLCPHSTIYVSSDYYKNSELMFHRMRRKKCASKHN
jgi:hypothetical protein